MSKLGTNSVNIEISSEREIEISTGKLAKLASGSCVLSMGDTVILVAVCSGPPRPGTDFFPLQVDYREKYSAAGKFPGGFIKREGRPSSKEILTARFTDRPLRPLFPEGFFDQVQIQALLLSADGENDSDVLCMLGASAALSLSDLPFEGPIGAVRVGYIDGEFIANPSMSERENSQIDLIYAGLEDKVIMIEGDAELVPEDILKKALHFANDLVKKQIAKQKELAEQCGKKKKEPNLVLPPEKMIEEMQSFCSSKIEDVCTIAGKEERLTALDELFDALKENLSPSSFEDMDEEKFEYFLKIAYDNLIKKTIRKAIIEKHYRPDGRGTEDLRELSAEVDVLPIVHGSGLFSRGETQALVLTTLGGAKDSQLRDPVTGGSGEKKFYMHYNFPNYSVGEVGRIMGPGRREIGHGNLAERSVSKVLPDEFPYTVRCVSEVMGSNGSTSMASVCGASLSLMAAGVPLKENVAGITCGLVTDENNKLLLTDIIGAEDHFGDMDFKVCGTRNGVSGFQLDLKLPGISLELLEKAFDRNNSSRMKILDIMDECISESREDINPNAPRIEEIQINPEKIGALIGPGGKHIKEICEVSGAQVDINDDGIVKILASDSKSMDIAREKVAVLTAEPEVGKIYRGTVKTVKDFGAFVEILPGQEGLVHISELANYRVGKVTDICKEGEPITVKLLNIDHGGKMRLSRKEALNEIDA